MAQGFVKPLTLLPSDWVTGEAILPGALFPRYGTYTPTPRAAEGCSRPCLARGLRARLGNPAQPLRAVRCWASHLATRVSASSREISDYEFHSSHLRGLVSG